MTGRNRRELWLRSPSFNVFATLSVLREGAGGVRAAALPPPPPYMPPPPFGKPLGRVRA